MWFETESVVLTAGAGDGGTDLNAFDNALRAGGIADFNLIKVTSIVPPSVPVYILPKGRYLIVGDGLMVPTIYGTVASMERGTRIAVAVGAGVPTDPTRAGVVFVHSCIGAKKRADQVVRAMVDEGMAAKGIDTYTVSTAAASVVVRDTWSAVVAAALFCDTDVFHTFKRTDLRKGGAG